MSDRLFSDLALNRKPIRRAFDRASDGFDRAAVLHREVRGRALERLRLLRHTPQRILDLGCGTGQARRWFSQKFPGAQVVSLDSSVAMLRQHGESLWTRLTRRTAPRICADATALPLRDRSVDCVFSNLMLPWCAPDRVFAEVRRVLNPGGVFSFTTFGPDTLIELRQAWAQVDRFEHVHAFADMHDLGDALVRGGFADPVLDVERFVLTYADIQALHRDLKSIGSVNALRERHRGLTTRNVYERLKSAYEPYRRDGSLPATFEVVYGQAWQSTQPLRQFSEATSPGSQETKVPLSALRTSKLKPK